MSTVEIQSCCNECKSPVVDDIHNGERICSGCGISLMNKWLIWVQKQKHQISKIK